MFNDPRNDPQGTLPLETSDTRFNETQGVVSKMCVDFVVKQLSDPKTSSCAVAVREVRESLLRVPAVVQHLPQGLGFSAMCSHELGCLKSPGELLVDLLVDLVLCTPGWVRETTP